MIEGSEPPTAVRGRLLLHGLRFFGHHGCRAEERTLGSHFVVDVELRTDIGSAAASDQLDSTVNYSEVYRQVRTLTEETAFNLLETLATRIAQTLLRMSGVLEVTVRVTKQPRLPGQTAGFAVEVTLS